MQVVVLLWALGIYDQEASPGLITRAISASPSRLRSSGNWCIMKVLSTTSNDLIRERNPLNHAEAEVDRGDAGALPYGGHV